MVFSVAMPATVNAATDEAADAVELVLWDFEGGTDSIEGWTFIDADGDGFNRGYHSNEGLTEGRYSTYSGDGIIISASYDNDTGLALTPDNWAVSPAFSLKNTSEATLSVWAAGQDYTYCEEVFALYAGTSPDPADMVKIGGDFTTSSDYINYTGDLSGFIGDDTVYVAIRHYNVTDMFYLDVDDVAIMAVELPDSCAPGTHVLTYYPEVTEATCTEDAHSAYYKCDVCGRYFLDQEGLDEVYFKDLITIPALGHDWGKAVSNEDGTHTHNCSRCGEKLTEDCTYEEIVKNGVSKIFCTECGYAVYSEVSGVNILFGCGFEEYPEGWMIFDEDGDGNNWNWTESESDAYEGSRLMYSASYDYYAGGALSPDNWLITPAFSLEGFTEARVSMWASGYYPSYSDETFAIYAGTSADSVDDFVKVSDDITTGDEYQNYTADLSAFVGEPVVYVAIRHYNCYDMYYLLLDLVEIYATSTDVCETHDLTFFPAVPPTATEDGNIDYYYCEECGRYYLDEEATQPVLYEDVIIPALGENAPQFTSHRIVLTGEVGVQFKVTLPEGFDATGSSVSFSVSDGRTSTMAVSDATPVVGENAYWFTCYINALELADTITATYNYGTDGSVADSYSAMNFIESIQEAYDDTSDLYWLVTDLQSYGHYLQLSGWTDGRSHAEITVLEGTELSDDDIENVRAFNQSAGSEVEKTIDGTGIEDVKFALTLNSQTVINFFVKLAEGEEIMSYTGCTPKGTQIIGGDTYYKFNTDEINVSNAFTDYTVTITTTSGTAEITANTMMYVDAVVKEGSTFPVEKQYAMVAYYYYVMLAAWLL